MLGKLLKSRLARAAALIAAIVAGGYFAAPQAARAQADVLSAILLQFETLITNLGASLGSNLGTLATNSGRAPNLPGYPPGATALQGSSADVAAASAVATLTSAASKTAYICHFRCTGTGATTAVGADITVAGPTTSEIYIMGVVSGATAINAPVDVTYAPCLPASAVNTNITVTMASLGTGALHAACAAEGYLTATAP